jgi:hypothetical protein
MQHVLYNFLLVLLLRLLLLIGVLQTSCDIHDVFQVGIQDFCWSLSSTMSESTSLVVNSEAVNVWACQESWWFLLLGCKFRRNSGRILAEFWITWNSDYFDRNVITAPPRLLSKKYLITHDNTFRAWCVTSQNLIFRDKISRNIIGTYSNYCQNSIVLWLLHFGTVTKKHNLQSQPSHYALTSLWCNSRVPMLTSVNEKGGFGHEPAKT